MGESRPLVIAHRGYSAVAPENTLPAFELAIEAGADLVELDYYHSSDGVPIVFHDRDLDRTTDGDKRWGKNTPVGSRDAATLTNLDAGAWFHPRYAGVKIPTLDAALDFIQAGSVTLIERKEGDAKTCVELLRAKNLINQVVVQAFDWNYLKDFHEIEPSQILGALGPPSSYDGKRLSSEEKELNPRWNDIVKELGARIIVWNRDISPEAVADAQAKGLKVWVYTINDAALANRLLDYGVDGIITDNPALIWRTLALRKE